MKLTLNPHHDTTFDAAELRDQLNYWAAHTTRGDLTAHVTLKGKIKNITIEFDPADNKPGVDTP